MSSLEVEARPSTVVDIGSLVDDGPWTSPRKYVLMLCALALVFDGLDNQILGFAIPSLIVEWKVSRGDFAPALALGFVGMAIGSPIGGLLSDRLGRKIALIASVALFGIATMAIASAGSVGELILYRFLSGLGLGGAVPAAMALTAEFTPKNRRSLSVILGIACIPIGGMIGGVIAAQILPGYGWRTLFFVSGVAPVVMAVILGFILPESPQYLVRRGANATKMAASVRRLGVTVPSDSTFIDQRAANANRPSFGALLDPELRRSTLAMCAAFFFCQLPVFVVYGWAPTLLTSRGLDVQSASFGLALFNLGGTAGCFVAAWAIGRFGSRIGILSIVGAAVVGAVILATLHISPANQPLLMSLLCIEGFFLLAAQGSLYALATHVYPPTVRSTGVGTAASFGRAGAIASAYVGSFALGFGNSVFFGMIAACLALAFLAVAIVDNHAVSIAQGSGRTKQA